MKIRMSLLFFLLPALFLMFGCGDRQTAGPETAPVFVIAKKIEKKPVARVIAVSGNIEGSKTVRLGFMVSGKINYIAVREGDIIGKGQLLASLDPENYRIAKEIADAQVAQIEDEYQRLNLMHERGSISESDYSKISNGLKTARAQQKLHTKNLAETRLYSPFRGVLLKRGVEVGEIIGAGLQLFGVSDIHPVHVNASVPENDLRFIRKGTEAKIYVASIDSAFSGRVIEVGSLAEPTTRAFSVRMEVQNPGEILRPGMTAEIQIPSDRKEEAITVPGEAVLRDTDNTAYVFVVDNIKRQAFRRKISLGKIDEDGIEVAAGLAPGELVVVGGQHKLQHGSFVALKQVL
ncbi:MAG TPA: efflux RND transporter periplasmic adaptor subunit [Smithellaceae bacterium]|mgnify:FL=1|nr:efflux RND transporter periplasmic adaptor subunit [Smithellaceae bacterium]HRS82490.1 efflux RND transporter periplasmic adaptor subunit [Smithellaceae bacterium]HRV44751.1 efflux RND transporter periplasmic adaptor subunit [Smithellaceae bacterium]